MQDRYFADPTWFRSLSIEERMSVFFEVHERLRREQPHLFEISDDEIRAKFPHTPPDKINIVSYPSDPAGA